MGKKKFGNKWLDELDNKSAQQYVDEIKKTFKVDIKEKRHFFLNIKNIDYLNRVPHMVGVKTYGQNYYLYLINQNGRRMAYFINYNAKHSSLSMVMVSFRFTREWYEGGTLIEGELIRPKQRKWVFLMSDLLVHCGQPVKHLAQRLEILEQMISPECFTEDRHTDVCKFEVKTYVPYENILALATKYVDNYPHKCSGIIFKRGANYGKSYLYIFPQNRTMTTKAEKSVVLELECSGITDIYYVYDADGERLGHAAVPNAQTTHLLTSIFKDIQGKREKMNCTYHGRFKSWVPVNLASQEAVASRSELDKLTGGPSGGGDGDVGTSSA